MYKHPNYDKNDFISNHLNKLVSKLTKESNKNIFIAGDFNYNLLNINSNDNVSEFLETLTNNFLLPAISLPTRVTYDTSTLIDNIFSNSVNPDTRNGNISINISDHLPSLTIIPKSNQKKGPK